MALGVLRNLDALQTAKWRPTHNAIIQSKLLGGDRAFIPQASGLGQHSVIQAGSAP
jgi:hypothetical protein